MFSPIRKLLSMIILLPVYVYRLMISPLLGVNCRFQPSCSEYAIDAIRLHGPLKGVFICKADDAVPPRWRIRI